VKIVRTAEVDVVPKEEGTIFIDLSAEQLVVHPYEARIIYDQLKQAVRKYGRKYLFDED